MSRFSYRDAHDESITQLEKALTHANEGTDLYQPILDKTITHLMDYKNPLRQNIARKRGYSNEWELDRRNKSSTAAEFVAEDGTFTAYQGTYDMFKFPYKIVGTKVEIRDKLIKTAANFIDVVLLELGARVREVKDYCDLNMLRGVCSATVYEGLETLITTNQQVACTTSEGGDDLTLAIIDEAIDLNIGEADMMICARKTRREINALMQSNQRWVNVQPTTVKGGFRVATYDNIPIFVSTNASTTQTFNGSSTTAQTGATCASIYIIDSDEFWMGVLEELHTEPLALTTSLLHSFEMLGYESTVLRNPLCVSKVVGINASAD